MHLDYVLKNQYQFQYNQTLITSHFCRESKDIVAFRPVHSFKALYMLSQRFEGDLNVRGLNGVIARCGRGVLSLRQSHTGTCNGRAAWRLFVIDTPIQTHSITAL